MTKKFQFLRIGSKFSFEGLTYTKDAHFVAIDQFGNKRIMDEEIVLWERRH